MTLTENVQKSLPGRVAPARLMTDDPGVAVIVPLPQLPCNPFGLTTTNPDGSVSVTAMPVSVTVALGLLTVNVSSVIPLSGTVGDVKPMLTVGGKLFSDPRRSDAVAPIARYKVDIEADPGGHLPP